MKNIKDLNLNSKTENEFRELISKGKLPHAVLLDGGNSVIRSMTSEFIAASFVCTSSVKPCGECTDCRKAFSNNHPDIIISDPESIGEKSFKIDLVRNIRSDAFILPNEASKKVYILRGAEKMNIQAQNALLKIIEEPPSYVRFIIECESRTAMLETILSRVSSFNLGSAEKVLDSERLQVAEDLAVKLAEALIAPVELDFMRLTAAFEKDKELFLPVISSFQLILRDAAIIKSGSDLTLSDHSDTAKRIALRIPLKQLTELVACCNYFNERYNMNANKNLLITRFCSVIRQTAYGN